MFVHVVFMLHVSNVHAYNAHLLVTCTSMFVYAMPMMHISDACDVCLMQKETILRLLIDGKGKR